MKDTIFKAYDIRGIYPDEIDEEAAYKVGRALVRFLSAKTIVVGRDMRLSSEPLQKRLIEGITAEGADVISIGLCTTPMLSFAVAHYGYDGGVMVSASHNPGNYNAFKIIKAGALQVDVESGLKDIQKLVAEMDGTDN
jgi:phosphomannomutase